MSKLQRRARSARPTFTLRKVLRHLSRNHAMEIERKDAETQRGKPQPNFTTKDTKSTKKRGCTSFQDFVTFVVEKFSQE
jgi:hypothetical protein